jgi:hypothetical protein
LLQRTIDKGSEPADFLIIRRPAKGLQQKRLQVGLCRSQRREAVLGAQRYETLVCRRVLLGQRIERAINLEGVDEQIAIAAARIFGFRVLEVVEEMSTHSVHAGRRHFLCRFIAAAHLGRGDIENLDFFSIQTQLQLRRLIARILSASGDAERIAAGPTEFEFGIDAAARIRNRPAAGVLSRLVPCGAFAPELLAEFELRLHEHALVRDDHFVSDPLGGREVFLHEQRREREHVTNVVETAAHVVGGKIVGGAKCDA